VAPGQPRRPECARIDLVRRRSQELSNPSDGESGVRTCALRGDGDRDDGPMDDAPAAAVSIPIGGPIQLACPIP